jgi:murein DD-endopeptidase MepM/ murein hydrolase activator NlpD
MRPVRRGLPAALTIVSLAAALGAAPASALSGLPGGTQAPPPSASPKAGGAVYGSSAYAHAAQRPYVSRLSVPRTATAGAPPRVALRLEEPGVGTVYVQVVVTLLSTRTPAASATLGWSHTGRTLYVRWPAGATLAPGSYRVAVSAHDHHGGTLVRAAHSSGVASLTVTAPPAAPAAATPTPSPTPTVEAGVPTPSETVAAGAAFPVVGEHSFGGPENRFGAARSGHIHQGQDVLAAEGTPVVVPMAGTITSTSYQAGGAGYYAVEHTSAGLDFMFAHCQAGSMVVSEGEPVSAGQALCHAGQTGDATAPHLHFEIWVGGWWAPGGHPIDPLPYLEAWERG